MRTFRSYLKEARPPIPNQTKTTIPVSDTSMEAGDEAYARIKARHPRLYRYLMYQAPVPIDPVQLVDMLDRGMAEVQILQMIKQNLDTDTRDTYGDDYPVSPLEAQWGINEASVEKSMRFLKPLLMRVWSDHTFWGWMEFELQGEDQEIFLEVQKYRQSEEGRSPEGLSQEDQRAFFGVLFDYIQDQVDPTRGKYTVWILDRYAIPKAEQRREGDGDDAWPAARYHGIRYWEDTERVHTALNSHNELKKRRFFQNNPEFAKYADINAFTKLSTLETFIAEHSNSVNPQADPYEKHKGTGFKELLKNSRGYVIQLETQEASVDLFRGKTHWCTAVPNSRFFDTYRKQAPLIVVVDTVAGVKLQGHNSPTDKLEILNAEDEKVDYDQWSSIDQSLRTAFLKGLGISELEAAVEIGAKFMIRLLGNKPMPDEVFARMLNRVPYGPRMGTEIDSLTRNGYRGWTPDQTLKYLLTPSAGLPAAIRMLMTLPDDQIAGVLEKYVKTAPVKDYDTMDVLEKAESKMSDALFLKFWRKIRATSPNYVAHGIHHRHIRDRAVKLGLISENP